MFIADQLADCCGLTIFTSGGNTVDQVLQDPRSNGFSNSAILPIYPLSPKSAFKRRRKSILFYDPDVTQLFRVS